MTRVAREMLVDVALGLLLGVLLFAIYLAIAIVRVM